MNALVSRLAILTVVLTTLTTVGALGARAAWMLELLSHFPLQFLVLQGLAVAACLVQRIWPWAVVALVAAVPNVVAVGPYLPGITAAPAIGSTEVGRTPVRLIASNLRYSQEDARSARAYFEHASADLLVLSEFTPRWRQKLRDLERTYPYVALRPRWNAWGIAVYSKFPLRTIENLDLNHEQSSHLRLLVELPDGLVELYAVHLVSPPGRDPAALRNTQLRRLGEVMAAADPSLPKIVAGDFNSTPYSPYFKDLLRDAGLRDGARPFGLQGTWPAWPMPLRIPIDHCLVGGRLDVTWVATGPRIGSDHLPLECTFNVSS